MSEDNLPNEANEPNSEDSGDSSSQPYSEEIRHSSVSARVPEEVALGVFSTGVVVLQGNYEFILDFLLRMTRPHQLAARVVLPIQVVPRLIAALKQNLENYTKQFGPPRLPELDEKEATADIQPAKEEKGGGAETATQDRVSPEEIYEQLKFSDSILKGKYANAVMIGHTRTEFVFDFVTTFFPRSVVSSRIYLAAPNVPRFLDSLSHSFQQFQNKVQQQKNPPPTEGDEGLR